ncbi:hypothetical protein BG000_009483 [Podila horticola]|nr:hypothetical protein BG000_009483 [Podila horticola]
MAYTPITALHPYNVDAKTEDISFHIQWETTATETQRFDIHSERGDFEEPDVESWRQMTLLYQFFGRYTTDRIIPSTMLPSKDNHYEVDICLSTASSMHTCPSEVTYPAVMMKRLFHDTLSYDVFFTFKNVDPWNPNSANQNVDNLITIVGAHESVISQWLFFKTLFDSDFVEGCTGTKKISVQGVKPKTFRLMIKFMYVGVLRRAVATLYEDETDNASWEGFYIAADRYRIYDLRMLALTTIEKNLDSDASIDFLFRKGYLYKELREMLVKNIAKKYHAEIAKKQFKDAHRDHPEFVTLMCELYDAYHSLSVSQP